MYCTSTVHIRLPIVLSKLNAYPYLSTMGPIEAQQYGKPLTRISLPFNLDFSIKLCGIEKKGFDFDKVVHIK